jgi:flavorubredoxin
MKVVIVYESLFGNTHEIATAIGAGVGKAQPGAQVNCLPVAQAAPAWFVQPTFSSSERPRTCTG